jgi:hypothetical protein
MELDPVKQKIIHWGRWRAKLEKAASFLTATAFHLREQRDCGIRHQQNDDPLVLGTSEDLDAAECPALPQPASSEIKAVDGFSSYGDVEYEFDICSKFSVDPADNLDPFDLFWP